jgi:hypothetical protein
VRQIGLGSDERGQHRAFEVEPAEAGFKRDQHSASIIGKGKGADRLGQHPDAVLAGRGIETVEARRMDVDPVEAVGAPAPDGAFAEPGLDVENAFHPQAHRCLPVTAHAGFDPQSRE